MGARQAVTRALTSSTHASRYVRSRARLFHVARARLFARPEKSVVRQWHHLVLCRVDHSSQFVVMLMGHRAPKLSLWWLAVVGMRTVSAPSSGGGICSVRSERCVNRCLSRAYGPSGPCSERPCAVTCVSVAVSGEANRVSVQVKSTLVSRAISSQELITRALRTDRLTETNT